MVEMGEDGVVEGVVRMEFGRNVWVGGIGI